MNAKDQWINSVENSLGGLKPAEANPYLYAKIMSRLSPAMLQAAPAPLVWLSAGTLLLLVFINIAAIKSWHSIKHPHKTDLQAIEMQLMNNNAINYN